MGILRTRSVGLVLAGVLVLALAPGCFHDDDDPAAPITVLAPSGGTLTEGEEVLIRWATNGTVTDVSIKASTDGGLTWFLLASLDDTSPSWQSFPWVVGTAADCAVPSIPTTGLIIKVHDYNITTIEDDSDVPITVNAASQSITVLDPNGGELIPISGGNYNIVFHAPPAMDVKILYSEDAGTTWNTVPGGGSVGCNMSARAPLVCLEQTWTCFPWDISGISSTQVLLRIEDSTASTVFDESDATFTVQ